MVCSHGSDFHVDRSFSYLQSSNVVMLCISSFKEFSLHNKTVPSIQFSCVNIELVLSLITSLDTHKTTGADGISSQFIRASPYMARLVTVLINKCIESSLVPRQWKQANVTPVPKCKYCTTLSHFLYYLYYQKCLNVYGI